MASQQFLIVEDCEGKKRLRLDEEVIRSYLLSEEVADKPVVVISVAGTFRTGKSFILDMMSRYLTTSDKSRWIAHRSEGFPWKSGCDAHTNGMSMSQPIPVTLQSGEEVVILLMDTQGIFDGNSTMTDSTRIFTLSTLLSSVQIFNVMNNLKGDDLDNLQLFAEYGRLAMDNAEGKPFQDLIFLIRDWQHTQNHGLGSQGGNELVEKRLSSNKKSLVQRREHINACFTNVSGFLLPHPGEAVASGHQFTGDAKDMDTKFVSTLEELMSTLLSPDKLSVKMNGSHPLTCRHLETLIKTCTKLFLSGELPNAPTTLQAIADVSSRTAVNEELLTYQRKMKSLLDDMLDDKLLHDTHEQAKADALRSLGLRRTVRDPNRPRSHWSRLLSDDIDDWFKQWRNTFKEKCMRDIRKASEDNERLAGECIRSYERSMELLSNDQLSDEGELCKEMKIARQRALDLFDSKKTAFGSHGAEAIRMKLEDSLHEIYRERRDAYRKHQQEISETRRRDIVAFVVALLAVYAAGLAVVVQLMFAWALWQLPARDLWLWLLQPLLRRF